MVLKVKIASFNDDPKIRELLRNNPIDGEIQLSYQREPNFFSSLDISGKFNQTVLVEENNDLVGFGTRSIRPVFINGEIKDIGYLSNLRVDKKFRGGGFIKHGYQKIKEFHSDNKVKFYFTTIIDDNNIAKKILTKKRDYLPHYFDFGRLDVYNINIKKIKEPLGIKIIRGNTQILDKIIEFIYSEGKKKQFFPYYTKKDFNSYYLREFNIKDFYIAIKDDNIIGVVGTWDQSRFKQIIINGYKGKMKYISKFNDLFHLNIPKVSENIRLLYANLITIKNNDPNIFRSLITKICLDNIKFQYLSIGLHENDQLGNAFKKMKYIKYSSRLYIVCWDEEIDYFKKIDKRTPYIEISTL